MRTTTGIQRTRWVGFFASLLVATLTVRVEETHAQRSSSRAEDARTLHIQAQRAYQSGRYEDALDLWQRAFDLEPRAGIQYNLSQCFGRLGRLDEESAALRHFLALLERETPERLGDAQADSARQRLVAIDERLDRTGARLVGVAEDASLFVDEIETDYAGGTVRLAPGPHALRIERPGYEPFRVVVTIVQGALVTVNVDYVLAATPTTREVIVERDAPRRSRRGLAIGLLAGSGGTLALGTTLGLVGLRRARAEFSGTDDGDAAVRRFGIPADVSFGVGAALAVAGTVVFVIERKHRDEPSVAPVVGAGTVGIMGTF